MSTESPQDSLQHYLDDLLLEGDSLPVSQPQKREESRPAPPELTYQEKQREKEAQAKAKLARLLSSTATKVEVKPALKEEPQTKVETVVVTEEVAKVAIEKPVIESPVIDSEVEEEVSTDSETTEDLMESLAWLDNGRPRWGQERFDVLLFSVSGLTLAVPLIALGQIQPLNDELTPLFGQADWFMGLQPTPMGKIRTVNTAKFVMPERYDESFVETAKYVISIDGLPWGLAVDVVNQPITLEPEDVKWRSERSKRAWLAGTVKQHMCALIDIPMMGQLLENEVRAKKI